MNIKAAFAFVIATTAITLSTATFAAPGAINPPTKDRVTITVGQKLTIQFQQRGMALLQSKTVEKPDGKTPSVTLDFKKNADGTLILTVQNDFKQNLQCQLLTRSKGSNDFFEVGDGKPFIVTASLAYIATWGGLPVEEVALYNPVLLPDETR
ncbi:MAG: hypothetical protein JWL59_1399 [Chthoniobacteraceae bacterium]|nr:hypothetical protein [Chthoniobacteraceae bacterium]